MALALPSSIEAVSLYSEEVPSLNCGSQVHYIMKAMAFSGASIQGGTAQRIKLYDSVDTLPSPICLEDFPGEYLCKQTKIVPLFDSTPSRVPLTIAQPKPVEMHLCKNDTQASFSISLSLCSVSNSSALRPFALHLSWALFSHTFISTVAQEKIPPLPDVAASPHLRQVTRIEPSWKRSIGSLHWRPDADELATSVCNIQPVLPLLKDSLPPPTFYTSFLTRRYSIGMGVGLVMSDQEVAEFELNIPVQLVYPRSSQRI
jgi:hypothetical protein